MKRSDFERLVLDELANIEGVQRIIDNLPDDSSAWGTKEKRELSDLVRVATAQQIINAARAEVRWSNWNTL